MYASLNNKSRRLKEHVTKAVQRGTHHCFNVLSLTFLRSEKRAAGLGSYLRGSTSLRLAVGLLLDVYPKSVGKTYAVNLFGSALGCVFAMLAPPLLGAEGTVTLSSGLAVLGALVSLRNGDKLKRGLEASVYILLIFICLDLGLRITGRPGLPATQAGP